MGTIKLFRRFISGNAAAAPDNHSATAPSGEPKPTPRRDLAVTTIDDILTEILDQVDEFTAARDERTIDRSQRDRAEQHGEERVKSFYLGPPKTTGPDQELAKKLDDATSAATAASAEKQRALEALEVAERGVPPELDPPNAPLVQLVATTAAMTGTVAMSLYGVEPFTSIALESARRALMYATSGGVLIAVAAVSSIYGLEVHDGHRTPIWAGRTSHRTTAFAASAVCVMSLVALRCTSAVSWHDVASAFAYGGVEVGLLAYAKSQGGDHRHDMDAWRESQAGRPAALTDVEIALRHLDEKVKVHREAEERRVVAERAWQARIARDFDLVEALKAGAAAGRRAYERRVDLNVEKARASRRQPAA